MTEFFREVDEDVRRDQVLRYWTKYRYLLLALAVLVVVGTGGWRLYGYYRDEAAQAASAKYEAATQLSRDGKSAEAAAAFDALSKTAPKGYAILARLRAADERAASDPRAAIEGYEALAADPSLNPVFRDFAKLRTACDSTATIRWNLNAGSRRSPRTHFPIIIRSASCLALPR
jgi:hypothetical protein